MKTWLYRNLAQNFGTENLRFIRDRLSATLNGGSRTKNSAEIALFKPLVSIQTLDFKLNSRNDFLFGLLRSGGHTLAEPNLAETMKNR